MTMTRATSLDITTGITGVTTTGIPARTTASITSSIGIRTMAGTMANITARTADAIMIGTMVRITTGMAGAATTDKQLEEPASASVFKSIGGNVCCEQVQQPFSRSSWLALSAPQPTR